MRLAWLTDLHFNFLEPPQIDAFLDTVLAHDPDAVLISGDIGEALSLPGYLLQIDRRLQRPVYFVLGNHDFYHGSFESVRAAVQQLTAESHWLTWLNEAGVIELRPGVGLVGHDSWADGRCGDYANSPVILNDYLLIDEFAGLNRADRLHRLHALGDAAAAYFRMVLPIALRKYRRLLLVTHPPPFREACWHEGGLSDDDFLPHFVAQSVGEALRAVMSAHPDRALLVLCGHTHGSGSAQVLPNLLVLTGGAAYGAPTVQRILDLADWG